MRIRLAAALLLTVASAGTAGAQTPHLVQDIDPATAPGRVGRPRALTRFGTSLYTLADTPTGRGLVRIEANGTPTLIRQVPSPASESFPLMTATSQHLFFNAQGGLWTSDGTTAGTTMLKQFVNPSTPTVGAGGEMASVQDVVYFLLGTTVWELWKSDGTAAGTVRVATTFGRNFTPSGNRLFFVGPDDRLWTTDGTEAGTVNLGPTVVDLISKMVAYGNGVLFSGTFGGSTGLWRSDGTSVALVKAFAPFAPHSLTVFGDIVLFAAGSPEGIWRTDGTEPGTTLVKDGLGARNMYAADGVVFLHGQEPATGRELWTTDGTAAGTAVLDQCPGSCSFLNAVNTNFATLPGGVVFSRLGAADLWRTDGTVAGIVPLAQFISCGKTGDLDDLTSFASSVYFPACSAGPESLWRTDGTASGTVMLAMGTDGASSSPAFAGEIGAKAIFAASRPDVGREIWSTEGTDASTQLLADMTVGADGTDWKAIASLGSVFTFTTPPLNGGGPLWSTDGSPGGTREIAAIVTDYTRRAAVRDGLAVFAGSPSGTFTRPYRTDGTSEGTFAVAPPEEATTAPIAPGSEPIAAHGAGFAVAMESSFPDGPTIWLSVDGRDPATRFALPVTCAWLASVEERLFLACPGTGGENDLWISDGTYSGTHLLYDLPGNALPGWVGVDGKLFFRVAGPTGASLWFSDGTTSGTAPLSSIATVPSEPRGLTVSGGVLFFAGFTFATGYELWRTDGTAAGTFLLGDLDPGPASGLPADFETDAAIAAVGGGVVFTATTATRGAELWRSDGTPAGTLPLAQIAPGPASSSPGSFRRAGSRVYFAADDGARGREPWAIELTTPSVSVGDATVAEGDAGTTTASFAVHVDLPSGTLVTVSYTAVAGSAQAGVDFVPTSGTLTFAPGARDLSVDVAVVGDVSDESDEAFALELTSAVGAVIADGHGAGVILDDDLPTVSTGGASVVEGDSGVANASFPVTLATLDGQPTAHAVVVRGDVVSGTAGPLDFPPILPGVWPSVSFPAGTPSGTTLPLLVPVQGDTLDEPNENFQLRLDGQLDATVAGGTPTGVILDDDGIDAAAPLELAHGSTIVGDLEPLPGQVADVDFNVMRLDFYSSYELVADGISGDVAPIQVQRMADNGAVAQTAAPLGSGTAVSMRWFGYEPTAHVRVSGDCAGACGADDVYRLRLYDTSLSLPRVNNSGSQTTVLILQNRTGSPVTASVLRWTPSGELNPAGAITSHTIPPHGTEVVDTNALPQTFTGSITVTNDAPYGGLVGKAVTFDPASGFAFDTPLTSRRR
jgi:ELWxxDGT repeat protein